MTRWGCSEQANAVFEPLDHGRRTSRHDLEHRALHSANLERHADQRLRPGREREQTFSEMNGSVDRMRGVGEQRHLARSLAMDGAL